ncbi:hypothetical protein VNO77_00274 [Canavalia gladiata]|uniref:Galactose oxidase n=1 Tax=Canavalia gladiata TaxID=3824 RepID=A0AAN9MPR0_CANGL
MAHLHKVLLIFTLLFFVVGEAKHKKNKHKTPKASKVSKPFPPFPNFPGNQGEQPVIGAGGDENKGDFEIQSVGHWDLISQNAGVSAMHINLLPTNKIIVFDATVYHVSRIKLPDGAPCLPYKDLNTQEDKIDCYAHAVEYDIATNQVRPLKIEGGDPWCSCGGVAPDGTFVSAGGFGNGTRSVRYMGPNCQDCEWREYDNVLGDDRWYATQQILPNGDFFLIGGRRAFSYEFIPREGERSNKSYFFPFLYETSDLDENNLYPFVHLSIDGNLFIFSNNRSILLNPNTHKIVRTFPVLLGGSRNYPASGMSALLPIDLNAAVPKVEVIVCGGNVPEAFYLAETKKFFLPALQDCNRLVITEANPEWEKELMPSNRTMGDALVLPNGQLLFINGAQEGTSAWWDADQPNFTPVLYSPEKPNGLRFKELKPSQIARMYHSTSAVLPNGKIWVSGSNTHNTYKDVDRFPTETRVEAFSPPYLDVDFDKYRPQINEDASGKELVYGGNFELSFSVEDGAGLTKNDIKVSMYFPPFTTHGFSMGQRLLFLQIDDFVMETEGVYRLRVVAPPSAQIAPPGYYLLFVVHRGLPAGNGMWVHIQ